MLNEGYGQLLKSYMDQKDYAEAQRIIKEKRNAKYFEIFAAISWGAVVVVSIIAYLNGW